MWATSRVFWFVLVFTGSEREQQGPTASDHRRRTPFVVGRNIILYHYQQGYAKNAKGCECNEGKGARMFLQRGI